MREGSLGSSFDALLKALLRVPKAEIDKIEAERPKRPKPKAK
jgi:hypothetical protein